MAGENPNWNPFFVILLIVLGCLALYYIGGALLYGIALLVMMFSIWGPIGFVIGVVLVIGMIVFMLAIRNP